MPRIFYNISETLLPALQETMELCERADFCVGYFNLRGGRQLHGNIEKWRGGEGHCCRLMVDGVNGGGTGVPPVNYGQDAHATLEIRQARMTMPLWQQYVAIDPVERAKLRAELDALVAHLYGLTEAEFAYILTTFPLVSDAVKIATHNAFRNVEKGLVK